LPVIVDQMLKQTIFDNCARLQQDVFKIQVNLNFKALAVQALGTKQEKQKSKDLDIE